MKDDIKGKYKKGVWESSWSDMCEKMNRSSFFSCYFIEITL